MGKRTKRYLAGTLGSLVCCLQKRKQEERQGGNMSKFLTTTAVAAALGLFAAMPALAQQPAQPAQPEAAPRAQAPTADFQYLQRQNPNEWAANTLIGMNVENYQGESLGSLNNIVVNEEGDVVAATIGVGGFLGIGQKDVAVPYEALEFRVRDAATTADRPAVATDRQTQPAQPQAETQPQAQQQRVTTFDAAQRDNIVLVLNVSREQLEAAPEYQWID
jgi:sporulation protein YlmC with PRC-barrel domain